MRRELKEQLKEWKQQHREVTGYGKKKKRQKKAEKGKSERLSESLMGTNRPIYERHRGTYRQK